MAQNRKRGRRDTEDPSRSASLTPEASTNPKHTPLTRGRNAAQIQALNEPPPGEAFGYERQYHELRARLLGIERQIWDMEERFIVNSQPWNLLRGYSPLVQALSKDASFDTARPPPDMRESLLSLDRDRIFSRTSTTGHLAPRPPFLPPPPPSGSPLPPPPPPLNPGTAKSPLKPTVPLPPPVPLPPALPIDIRIIAGSFLPQMPATATPSKEEEIIVVD